MRLIPLLSRRTDGPLAGHDRRGPDPRRERFVAGGFATLAASVGAMSLWACTATPATDAVATASTRVSASSAQDVSTSSSNRPSSTTPASGAPTTTSQPGNGAASPATTSTEAGVRAAQWGNNVTIAYGDGSFTFSSNGIPNHARPAYYAVPKRGIRVPTADADLQVIPDPTGAQDIRYTISTSPTYSTTSKTMPGPIGVMISGAMLFNPYEADQTTIALDHNFSVDGYSFIDNCSGHPNGQRMYHYHGVPYCITSVVDTPGKHSAIIGIALDGFPIYGPQDEGGVAAIGLDECNGEFGPTPEFPNGIYHYHLTADGYHTMNCLHGAVTSTGSHVH